MAGKLYIVGTPIGNLGDLTARAEEIFASVDFIAAEDTRVTVKLLNHLSVRKPLVSYYEHNRRESGEKILTRILSGESCALVSDAGMPAVSDPGEDLVRLCAENGIEVRAVPGPCAAVCALALSALPSGRFTFEGFLSTSKKSRYAHLNSLVNEKRTMIFYEAPHKLLATLSDMENYFGGGRNIAICREITKLHEETLRLTLAAAVEHFQNVPPRGEFVIVVQGAPEDKTPELSLCQGAQLVLRLHLQGEPLKKAARQVAADTALSANDLYNAALKLKNK